MQKERLLTMLEIAIMSALALVLGQIKFGALWPMGGSISLIMVPIFIMTLRHGWRVGVITGFLVGILDFLFGGYVVHPIQLILDYPLAYTVLGLGGLALRGKTGQEVKGKTSGLLNHVQLGQISLMLVIGTSLRLLCHFISGIVWFGSYAPEGVPAYLYSLGYNASYLVPEAAISLVVLIILAKRLEKS